MVVAEWTDGDLHMAIGHAQIFFERVVIDGKEHIRVQLADRYVFVLGYKYRLDDVPTFLANSVAYGQQCDGAIRPYDWYTDPLYLPLPDRR